MVVAITVTYNGSETLAKTIEALLEQSVSVSWIIIVDNASSAEHLAQIKEMSKLDARIIHLRLEKNTGGAGGFQAGMEYALERFDPDWYWLMDDDAYPDKDCLKNLLRYQSYSDNIGCLAPLIWGIDLKKYQLYHHKKVSAFLVKDIPVVNDVTQMKDVTAIEANAFVGPLISRQAVKTLGVADGSLFIYGDDLEYTYRLSRYFDVLLIKDAVINHRDPLSVKEKSNPNEWWKEYYMFRNRFLFIQKFQTSSFNRVISETILFGKILKKQMFALVLPRYRGLRLIRCKVLARAYKDGISGVSGVVMLPSDFHEWVKNKISKSNI